MTLSPVASVTSVERVGAYTRIELEGRGLGGARPGQFLALATGGPGSAQVAARAFSVADADPARDTGALLVAEVGPGTVWLAARRPGDAVPVTGPLGHAFTLPAAGSAWVGVGGGYGSAPLAWAAREAARAGAATWAVSGASTAARLCDTDALALATAGRLSLTTDDGSAGTRGRVSDVLPGVLAEAAAAVSPGGGVVVAACGPMAMLAAVAGVPRTVAGRPVRVEVAVEERMACGVGVCMTCVVPLVARAGRSTHLDGRAGEDRARMARACVEGPVLDADDVLWDARTPAGFRVPVGAR